MDWVQHAGKSCCVLKLWGFSKLDIEHLEISIYNHWFWKRKAVTQICEFLFLSRLKLCLLNGEDMNVDELFFLFFPDSRLSLESSPHWMFKLWKFNTDKLIFEISKWNGTKRSRCVSSLISAVHGEVSNLEVKFGKFAKFKRPVKLWNLIAPSFSLGM